MHDKGTCILETFAAQGAGERGGDAATHSAIGRVVHQHEETAAPARNPPARRPPSGR